MPHSNPKPTFEVANSHLTTNTIAAMSMNIIRLTTLTCAAGAALLVTSCATTGDPSTGGIFWSERKAQGRLAERQDKLEHIERHTSKTERKSAETQRKIDELQ